MSEVIIEIKFPFSFVSNFAGANFLKEVKTLSLNIANILKAI